MITDKELDDLFKNTLGSHESAVPPDMWQRVQPAEKTKRGVIFWWQWYAVAALFLLAGMITTWWCAKQPATNNLAAGKTSITQKKHSSNGQQSYENNKAVNKTSSNIYASPAAEINSKSIIPDEQKKLIVSFINKRNTTVTAPANNHLIIASITPNTTKTAAIKKDITLKNDIVAATTDNNAILVEKAAKSNVALKDTGAKPAAKDSTAALTTNDKKNKHLWTIELFAASAYSDKETYDIGKESQLFSNAIVNKEPPKTSLQSYGAGIRAGVTVSKKVVLKTGLEFIETRQKIAYQQQTVNSFIAVNAPADTSIYRQILYQPQYQKSVYNSVSIPLLISYQTGKKIQAGITAGAVVNAHSWYKGKIPNATGTATLQVKKTYKPVTGAAFYLSASAAKKINNLEIFAEPYLQYSLNSFTKQTVPFKQKINSYGVSIGVRTALHK